MWIAAIALQHSLTVLTRDAHFNDVDGLAVQGW
jgi:tRNA(fMet)-specific endonuclease VapC